jgi:hypothetical protein
MFVTSLRALAMSVRSTLGPARSKAVTSTPASRKSPPARVSDSVELSKRVEALARALDAGGDGVATEDELTDGAIELLRRASLRFHHQKIARSSESAQDRAPAADHLHSALRRVQRDRRNEP